MREPQLILNRWRTPDGTILTSHRVHQFVSHKDKNGNIYSVDGGNYYARLIDHKNQPLESLCVFEHDPFELKRKSCYWGTYGVNGDEPLRRVSISEMNTNHILKVLEYKQLDSTIKKNMVEELKTKRPRIIYEFYIRGYTR